MAKRNDDEQVSQPVSPDDAAARWRMADSDRAAETRPHEDAEQMEDAMREHGFLVTDDDDPDAQGRRRAPTNPGIPT
jgi:hypothetical protein